MQETSSNVFPEAAGLIPGRLLFTSAVAGASGNPVDQTRRTVETLNRALAHAGAHRVVHQTAYYAGPDADPAEIRPILNTAFAPSHPALTERFVDRLSGPGASVELELTADLGEPLPDEPLVRRFNLEPHGRDLSQAVIVNGGRLLYLAGQVANNPDGSVEGIDDPARQTEKIYQNIEDVLRAGNVTLEYVVRETIWVLNMETWLTRCAPVRRQRYRGKFPAASIAQIRALSRPEQAVEIEVIAVAPS